MLDFQGLRESILEIKDKIHIMGVCAGMIMLSKTNNYNCRSTFNYHIFICNN